MLNKELQKELSKLISESTKNDLPDNNSNYFKKIDSIIEKIVKNQNKIIINKAIELIDSKRINLQNLESNYQESREVNLIKENKNNPHSFIKNQNELNKYNEGLSDAIKTINELKN